MLKKEQVTTEVARKMRLIRMEEGFSQDKMAETIGISKKTLVQIEKGRVTPGWNVVVTTVALFSHTENLQAVLGDEPLEVVKLIAHEKLDKPKEKTMGGRVWWTQVERMGRFKLQQNVISQHYRILDEHDYRWFSTFDREEAMARLEELGAGS